MTISVRCIFHISLLVASCSAVDSQASYKGHKIVRVNPETEDGLQFLHSLQEQDDPKVQFWRGPASLEDDVDMHLAPDVYLPVTEELGGRGAKLNVVIDDIQRMIEDQQPGGEPQFNFTNYHTYEQILGWLFEKTATCENCKLYDIGRSYEGRKLVLMRIGRPIEDGYPVFWLDGGLHAREWISPAVAIYVIHRLLLDYPKNNRIKKILDHSTWYILPLSNPDGYHYTWTKDRLWRKNRSILPDSDCIGVDLNRNWAVHWEDIPKETKPCGGLYRGPSPFSEPESTALATVLWSIRDKVAVYISLHAYGQLMLTPWAYSENPPQDLKDLMNLGRHVTDVMRKRHNTEYKLGPVPSLLYIAHGSSLDWAKGIAGIKYTYTLELRDKGSYGFLLPPEFILPTGEEVFDGIEELAGLIINTDTCKKR